MRTDMSFKNSLAIIDLGGQYCHLISRRLRDLKVWSDIFPSDVSPDVLRGYAGVILSGGPRSVWDTDSPSIDSGLLALDVPVLGICYGHQLLAKMLGGEVAPSSAEFGRTQLLLIESNSLFSGTHEHQTVWMSHSDAVIRLPRSATRLAHTDRCANAAYADFDRRFFGVQFHPEVVHSEFGSSVLGNFARRVCGLRDDHQDRGHIDRLVRTIRKQVGDDSVFFFVSGGVDSTVAFALCAKALPKDRILGVYVDTGLMRKGETEEFRELLEALGLDDRLRIRDERQRFIEALSDVVDPEDKRRIIGRLFVQVQKETMQEYGIDENKWLLGQGTIYPDTIESGGSMGSAAVIKTHHNRCEEILCLLEKDRVVEPLTEFYKDEVRRLGQLLGLDRKITQRWPFPGPGLAIRCLCNERSEECPEPLELPEKFYQFQATQIPIRTVGVQGDGRTYRQAVALSGPVDYELLQEISTSLCNDGTLHNRVIFLIAGNESDLRYAKTKEACINEERLSLLRSADFVVRSIMERRGLLEAVWQFPVVLVPLSFASGETIVLRPVSSEDGMTADFTRLNEAVLREIGDCILKEIRGIDAVFLDITDKPPATIEWE